jgi:hypothetical protein
MLNGHKTTLKIKRKLLKNTIITHLAFLLLLPPVELPSFPIPTPHHLVLYISPQADSSPHKVGSRRLSGRRSQQNRLGSCSYERCTLCWFGVWLVWMLVLVAGMDVDV